MEDIRALLTDITPNIAFIKLDCIEVCKVKKSSIIRYCISHNDKLFFLNVQVDEEVLGYIERKRIGLQLNGLVNASDGSPMEV